MALQTRIGDLITAVGTDYKNFRTWMFGSLTGTLADLTTTNKTSFVAAINEVKAAATGAPPSATEIAEGVGEIATQAEVDAGTVDTNKFLNPLKFQTRLAAFAQPLSANLTSLSGQASTAYGRAFLNLANQAGLLGLFPATSDTVASIQRNATQAEVNTGTLDTAQVTPLKLQTRLAAFAQPLNANLTNLAGVTNTVFGRNILTYADAAALTAALNQGTETLPGTSEVATTAEVTTATDDARHITPLKLQQRLAAVTIPLSYLDTDVALAANSDVKVATQKAVKAYADGLLDANNAYAYKGVIDASANPNYPAASAGHTYRISVAGKIGGASGVNVEQGDMVTALVDGTAAGNQATVGANWVIVQSNIDGAVVGPASSVAGDFATFSGTTGKVVQDSGLSFDTDGAMAANSNVRIPSQAAVRTYTATTFYTKTELGNPETDLVAAYVTAKA